MISLFKLARPALFCLDAETAHGLSIKALKTGAVQPGTIATSPILKQNLFGLDFENPVCLAAGFDKNAEVIKPVLNLGFAATEVGSLTPLAQSGNPKPRIFRLQSDLAVINRLGFNNEGHVAALKRLKAIGDRKPGIVGINIGANKTSVDFIADYETGLKNFWPFADYFTANISSPNTPGLRDLQTKSILSEMLDRLAAKQQELERSFGKKTPILLKIAPDLDETQIDDIAEVINDSALAGVIISNTTVSRPDTLVSDNRSETGGLSGKPLFKLSTIVLAKMRTRITETKPIIGVGGIHNVETALQKLSAGASLIQFYSGMVYAGPGLAGTIITGLAKHLEKNNISHISELIGSEVEHWSKKPIPNN